MADQLVKVESRRPSEVAMLQRRRSGNRIVLFMTMAAAGMLLLWFMWGKRFDDGTTIILLVIYGVLFSGGWSGVVVYAFIFAKDLKGGERVSNREYLSAAHRPAPVRIETRQGNVMQLGKFGLERDQWGKLAHELALVRWRWTRANVRKAGVFKNITAPGVYKDITSDFVRIGAVADGVVTQRGREEICRIGGLEIVL